MKFGDKLIQLRKKNGLSQEELAEKLNVSRQSVSKWESNNTYPETDKIIQICNIFDCSMDDLINDKVSDIEQTMRKNKNNLNDALDSLLDFITKTVNMFSKMSFKSGLKCIFELAIISIILLFIGTISFNIIESVIYRLINFLDFRIIRIIKDIIIGILEILWFIVSVIILIHTFKIRYLNYYEESEVEVKEKKTASKENVEFKEEKERIIIRDEKDRPFAFLKGLSKFFTICFKLLILWILFGIGVGLIGLIVIDVITTLLISTNSLFLGLFLSLLSITIIGLLIFTLGVSFVFNKKIPGKISIIVIVSSLVLCGIGASITTISIKNINIKETSSDIYKLEEKEFKTTYEENMAIKMNDNNVNYIYKIDNTMNDNDILLKTTIDTKFHELRAPKYHSEEDEIKIYYLQEEFNRDYKAFFELIKSDLKNNQIHVFYDYDEEQVLTIIANENTINKLLDNFKKLYLVEEVRNSDEISIKVKDYKVYFPYGVRGTYNAVEDKVYLTEDDDYSCVRSITETEYGDKIIYSCKWDDED